MFKILQSRKISSINVMPGDKLQLSYTEPNGKKHTALTQNIEKAASYDKVIAFLLENEFGLKEGLGGIFGKDE